MKLFRKKSNEKPVFDGKYYISCSDPVLLSEIERVKNDMEAAYANFQNELDPDMIDSYIFARNAAVKRYHFLLKQAKLF